MIVLRPASTNHILELAQNMRASDVAECAVFNRTPEQALERSLRCSLWALTAFEDEVPIAMLGVQALNMIDRVGVPWMLGSDRIYDNARALVKMAPKVIEIMREDFNQLENFVSSENDRAISFLRHYGWNVTAEQVRVGNVDFVRFF